MPLEASVHKLPNEILDLIFSKCQINNLLHYRSVCRRWSSVIESRLRAQTCLVLCPEYSRQFECRLPVDRRCYRVHLPHNNQTKLRQFFNIVNKLFPSIKDLSLLYFCNEYSKYIGPLFQTLSNRLSALHIDQMSIKDSITIPKLEKLEHLYLFNVNCRLNFSHDALQNLRTLQFNSITSFDSIQGSARLFLDKLENGIFCSETLYHYHLPNLTVLELRFLTTDDWNVVR